MKKILLSAILGSIVGGAVFFYTTGLSAQDPGKKEVRKSVVSPVDRAFKVNTLGEGTRREQYKVYGYLPYWTLSEAENLDLSILTDIAYFGVEIDPEGNLVKKYQDGDEVKNHSGYWVWRNDPLLTDLMAKTRSSGTRTALTVISHEDSISTEFLNCPDCWDTLYQKLKSEMDYRKINDINLNFEFYQMVDKGLAYKYTEFARKIKRNLQKDMPGSKVTVTAFADSIINDRITDIESISKVVDEIFIMAYDFHVMPESKATPVSPMGGRGIHSGYDIKTMIKDYLSYVPPQKLILGVPYYGFNWSEDTFAGDEETFLDIATDSYKNSEEENAEPEKQTNTLIQTYDQIMTNVEDSGAQIHWDELGQVPYYEYADPESGNPRKVYFENEKSLRVKYRIAKEFNLAGVGIWALGYDSDRPELWNLLEEEFVILDQ
jgi:spore germination protein